MRAVHDRAPKNAHFNTAGGRSVIGAAPRGKRLIHMKRTLAHQICLQKSAWKMCKGLKVFAQSGTISKALNSRQRPRRVSAGNSIVAYV